MAVLEGITLQVSVARSFAETYAFLALPENFPRWASGLAAGLTREGERWFGAAPQGRLEMRFSARNEYGVADHWVVMADGDEVYVPLRVLAAGSGSAVLLTLFRTPDMSDAKFAEDRAWVERDLRTLKGLLEAGG